jgi:hypothetical protein
MCSQTDEVSKYRCSLLVTRVSVVRIGAALRLGQPMPSRVGSTGCSPAGNTPLVEKDAFFSSVTSCRSLLPVRI